MKTTSLLSTAVLLVAASACNDYGVTVQPPPDAPTIEIQPDEPRTTDRLRAEVIDLEENLNYSFAWFQDGQRVDGLESDAVPPELTAKGELWQVEVTPRAGNLAGTVGRAEVEVLNSPPTLSASWANPTPSPFEDLQVISTTFDADDDEVSLSFAWSVDGEEIVHDAPDLSADLTERGQIWEVTISTHDGEEDGESVTLTAEIGNTPPEVGGVTVAPDPAFTDSTLVATAHDVFDADGDVVTLFYDWYVEGSLVQSSEDPSLSGDHFVKHESVHVEVTPDDGATTGSPVSSAPLVISNSPPSVDSAAITPPVLTTLTDATCTPGTFSDADGDPEGYTYGWTVNGSAAGSTSALPSSAFVRGNTVVCTLTPFDGEDEGAPVSSPSVVVANTPPVLDSVAITPSSPRVGDTLSAVLGSSHDADSDPITFRYAWSIDGVPTGHTGSTFSSFSPGNSIRVTVTPNDGFEDGTPVTSGAVSVENTPPVIHSLTLSPRPAYTNTPVMASTHATDADGDELAYTYTWFVDGVAQSTTGGVLGSSAFVKHQTVYAQVRVSDGIDTVGPYSSDPLVISNRPPSTPPTPNLTPIEPYDDDSLTCSIGSPSTDVDGDSLTYDVQFFRDGMAAGTYTTSSLSYTLPSSHTSIEETWSCRFRARDSDGATSGWSGFSPSRMIVSDLYGAEVLYFTDYALGTDTMRMGLLELEADGLIELTIASTRAQVRTALVSSTPPDIVVYYNQNEVMGSTDVTALASWVYSGGRLIHTDWYAGFSMWDDRVFTALQARYTGPDNESWATLDVSLRDGVRTPMPLSNPGWSYYTMGMGTRPGGVSQCTFPSGASCLINGNGGRTFAVGFLNDTVSTTDGRNFARNLLTRTMESL